MSVVSPLSEQMGPLLAKYTPEQIAEFVDTVMKMQPAAPPAAATPEPKKRSRRMAATSKVAQKAVVAPSHTSNNIAPRRPVNSWMAFRSFYSPIFKSYQQKEISGFLTRMWQADPFKAKWSILAKAYSIIREHKAKNVAPLDKFLSLTCPHIGIIPRDAYLAIMGWELVEENGDTMMEDRFTPDITSFPENTLTTNLSAEGVVAFCHHVNYVQDTNGDIARVRAGVATLAMAAQPAINSTQPASATFAPAPAPAHLDVTASTIQSELDQEESALIDMIQAALDEHNDGAAGASTALRQTVHDLSGQQYPFNDQFDPYAVQPVAYDPFANKHDAAFSTSSIGTYLAPGGAEFPETFNVDDFLSNDIFDMAQ